MGTFLTILAAILNLIKEEGPLALPLIEGMINSSNLTPDQKAILIRILEAAFPMTGSAALATGVPAHDQVAAMKLKWKV